MYIMVKRHHKGSDGKYHIKGKKYEQLIGSRAQVMHGTAYKTKGDLTKDKLGTTNMVRLSAKRSLEAIPLRDFTMPVTLHVKENLAPSRKVPRPKNARKSRRKTAKKGKRCRHKTGKLKGRYKKC